MNDVENTNLLPVQQAVYVLTKIERDPTRPPFVRNEAKKVRLRRELEFCDNVAVSQE